MTDEELLEKIASNIQKERKNKGFTQEAFAEKINKTWSHVSKLESGKNNFTLTTLNKIAFYLDTPLENLLKLD